MTSTHDGARAPRSRRPLTASAPAPAAAPSSTSAGGRGGGARSRAARASRRGRGCPPCSRPSRSGAARGGCTPVRRTSLSRTPRCRRPPSPVRQHSAASAVLISFPCRRDVLWRLGWLISQFLKGQVLAAEALLLRSILLLQTTPIVHDGNVPTAVGRDRRQVCRGDGRSLRGFERSGRVVALSTPPRRQRRRRRRPRHPAA